LVTGGEGINQEGSYKSTLHLLWTLLHQTQQGQMSRMYLCVIISTTFKQSRSPVWQTV